MEYVEISPKYVDTSLVFVWSLLLRKGTRCRHIFTSVSMMAARSLYPRLTLAILRTISVMLSHCTVLYTDRFR